MWEVRRIACLNKGIQHSGRIKMIGILHISKDYKVDM